MKYNKKSLFRLILGNYTDILLNCLHDSNNNVSDDYVYAYNKFSQRYIVDSVINPNLICKNFCL